MKVRSVTVFSREVPQDENALQALAAFGAAARAALEGAGYTVQTVRLATPPWPRTFADPADAVVAAMWLDQHAPPLGIEYVSLGPVQAAEGEHNAAVAASTAILAATQTVFCSVEVANAEHSINVGAAVAAAKVIEANSRLDANGFGNLRFAVLANVHAGSPFFPAAYSDPAAWPDAPFAFALALESADLAVEAYREAGSLQAAMEELTARLEATADGLVAVLEPLAVAHGAAFLGLDFSLAPFPDAAHSGAGAIESLGAAPFGASGTLVAAALTTQALQSARYPRCGFSGLMLPVLEDLVLAARAGEGTYNLHSLLLFSAVCGTGLDTVPLPGNTSPDALAAILLDVAALAVRLDKPLTARLMPIPGKRRGDATTFDFPFFANGAILDPLVPRGGALLGEAQLRLNSKLKMQN